MSDVGTTRRLSMPPMRRLRIFEAHAGVCCLCRLKINAVKDRWIVEHIRALELGGEDADTNCAPAHESCAIEKTKVDHTMAAKAKRMKARHLGIRASSSRPFGFGRQSPFKKKISGEVVLRDDERSPTFGDQE